MDLLTPHQDLTNVVRQGGALMPRVLSLPAVVVTDGRRVLGEVATARGQAGSSRRSPAPRVALDARIGKCVMLTGPGRRWPVASR